MVSRLLPVPVRVDRHLHYACRECRPLPSIHHLICFIKAVVVYALHRGSLFPASVHLERLQLPASEAHQRRVLPPHRGLCKLRRKCRLFLKTSSMMLRLDLNHTLSLRLIRIPLYLPKLWRRPHHFPLSRMSTIRSGRITIFQQRISRRRLKLLVAK